MPRLKTLLTAAFLMFCSGTLLAVNYTQNYTTAVNKTLRLVSTGSGNNFQVYDNGILNAATYDAFGPITVSGGGTLTIIFDTSKPVNIFGSNNNYCIFVSNGTVDIKLGDNYSASPTLIRSTDCEHKVFYVNSSTSDNQASCVLNITGKENNHFIVDGRANLQVRGTNETGYTATNTGTGVVQAADALLVLTGNGGYVDFEYVDLVNNVNGSGGGGAIAFGLSYATAHFHLEMTHGKIEKCFAYASGAAWNFSGVNNPTTASEITMEDCIIQDCFTESNGASDGGTFRTWSGPNCDIVMRRCQILNNKSKKRSGGIMYNLARSQPMVLDHCTFDGNWGDNGGAIQLQAAASLTACTIINNYAQGNGGGICNRPYDGGSGNAPDYYPHNGSLILDENTTISNNEARGDGGGIYVLVSPTNYRVGFSDVWTVYFNNNHEQFSMNVELEGATISNNKATNGGGIFIYRDFDVYQTNAYLNWGSVENNTATGLGGACYVFSDITAKNYYKERPDEGSIDVPSTFERNMIVAIGSSSSAHTLTMQGNVSGNGGGVYATYDHNTSVTSSTIKASFNQNCIVGSQASPNVANSGSGGALYMDKGDLTISGGIITYNTATVNGGGIYTTTNANVKVDAGDFSVQHNMVNGVPNNLYLPTNKKIEVISDEFDPQYIGIYTQSSTPPIPVFEVTNAANYTYLQSIYDGMIAGTMNVVDDKQLYSAEYTSQQTILYFGNSSPWSPLQKTATLDDLHLVNGVYEISNVKELTAFLWHVNGITTHGDFGSGDASAKGKLTADIDMYGHYWVPIGKSTAAYTGTFDGNGYTISNLTMVPTNNSTGRGMFGVNSSGTITNVVLRDCYFGSTTASTANYMGGIVSQNNSSGKVSNNVVEGTFHASNSYCIMGGIAGNNSGTIHSSFATPSMEGYQMGGLVGANSGNLFNSFANASFDYKGASKYCGGLVGVNSGAIENCYVRLQGAQPASNFGWLVGQSNNANIKYCYIPNGASPYKATGTEPSGHGSYGTTSVPYLYNHRDNQITLVSGTSPYVSNVSGADKQMLIALNNWVTEKNTTSGDYMYWLRTTTKTINDDLPILRLPATNAVAATDGEAYLDYNQVNELLTGYTTATKAICLYGQEGSMNSNSGSAAPLYFDQEAALIPATDGTVINGYTSQMINKYESSRWHNFSSPLQQSDIGFTYNNTTSVPFDWTDNPCSVTIASDDDYSLFPSNLLSKTSFVSVDLYCFYEPEYHWLNLKRSTNSHWHMNATTVPINYVGNGIGPNTDGNETYLVPGKGYLVSIDVDQLLQNYGTLNNGDVTLYSVTKSDYNAWAERLGFNLLGNPYQSYLDFEAFKSQNASNLWAGSSVYDNTYATFDSKLNSYVQYKEGTSYGALTASQYIHPHQGFFIRMTKGTNSSTTVTYTNTMRSLRGDDKSQFRGGKQPAYPVINFVVNDSDGNADIAVLELGRTEDDGATKMRMNECKGMISLGYGNEEFGILFRTEVEDYQSLRFEATEEGTFTLTWNTANAEFDKLTLIDNITGTTTDMLDCDSYSFEATPDQYASRFKVVIGDYKGIDESGEDGPSTGSETCNFAFQQGDQLVVNGEGELQIVDMLGRVVMTDQLIGSQSTTSLPKTAGVYVLRLTNTNGTRTQKMVIR